MSIARDATATVESTGTSVTLNTTVAAGSNMTLKVGVVDRSGGGQALTGVTWNGTSMAFVGRQSYNNAGAFYSDIYELAAPASGTHDIVASFNTSVTASVTGTSFSGSSQSATTGNAYKGGTATSAGGNSITINPVSITDNSWAFSNYWNLSRVATDGTNFVQYGGSGVVGFGGADSNADLSTAGTETITANSGAVSAWLITGIVFAPAAAAAVNSNMFLVL